MASNARPPPDYGYGKAPPPQHCHEGPPSSHPYAAQQGRPPTSHPYGQQRGPPSAHPYAGQQGGPPTAHPYAGQQGGQPSAHHYAGQQRGPPTSHPHAGQQGGPLTSHPHDAQQGWPPTSHPYAAQQGGPPSAQPYAAQQGGQPSAYHYAGQQGGPPTSHPYAGQQGGPPTSHPYAGQQGGGPSSARPYVAQQGGPPTAQPYAAQPYAAPSAPAYLGPIPGGSPPTLGSFGNPLFPLGMDPKLVACFQVANQDGSGLINDEELQRALSFYKHSFSLRTVHFLMYFFTNTNNRKIGPREFIQVFNLLQNWRAMFERVNRDMSGKIGADELREALFSLGFYVSPAILEMLVAKFDRAIEYDNFIECCVTIMGLTEKFKERDGLWFCNFHFSEFHASCVAIPLCIDGV